MKKLLLISAVILFAVSSSYAKQIYVSSVQTNLFKEGDRSSQILSQLKKGDELTLISAEGSWLKVNFSGKQGYVSKIVTSDIKPAGKVSLLGSAGQNARIHARKRASSDVTAASARGLMDDDKAQTRRSRAVDGRSDSDFRDAVNNMEKLYISENDLLSFLTKANIR